MSSGTATGSGFAFDNGDVLMRTLPVGSAWISSELRSVLPKDSEGNYIYGEGQIVNRGFMNTMCIILHRNKLLADDMFSDFQVSEPQGHWEGNNWISETTDLGRKMYALSQKIQQLVSDGDLSGETYYDKYRQLYYPAASVCYAYEPEV